LVNFKNIIQIRTEQGQLNLRILDICPNGRITEAKAFKPISETLTLTITLKHKNVFGKTKWRHISGKSPDTESDKKRCVKKIIYCMVKTQFFKQKLRAIIV